MGEYEIYAKIRDSKGLKDSDVSRLTGISQGTISDWKSGRYLPKADKISKIAEVLGVSEEYLNTGADSKKTSESGKEYYFSDSTAEMAQELFENSDMRILFDAAKDARPEDLQMAASLLQRMKATNPNG